jgi:hypothetical protein
MELRYMGFDQHDNKHRSKVKPPGPSMPFATHPEKGQLIAQSVETADRAMNACWAAKPVDTCQK